MNLWFDDIRDPPFFCRIAGHVLDRGDWIIARNFDEAIKLLETGQVEYASLDHDIGLMLPDKCFAVPDKTGSDLVNWMEQTGYWPKHKPEVHSANPVGTKYMRSAIDAHYGKLKK